MHTCIWYPSVASWIHSVVIMQSGLQYQILVVFVIMLVLVSTHLVLVSVILVLVRGKLVQSQASIVHQSQVLDKMK